MKVVLSWLREFAPTDLDAEELAELITARGVKVEDVLHPWSSLEGVVAARVVGVADHPDSDTLCVARVDDGTGVHQVVVGVRNMEAGDLVPWARPGARVPTLPVPLGAKELRGEISNGMLCAPDELAISADHGGILLLNGEGLEPGADVRDALGLDDAVLDIEVEPNRPDFLSVYGVAREVAAATGVPLQDPDLTISENGEPAAGAATIELRAPDGCPAYLARVIRGVGPSAAAPLRVQARLTAAGMRPLSAIVDATNYAMLELGQPLHAFDLDRLAGPGIVVRRAADGERLVTLDGVERRFTPEDLLICDVERPVAVAGIMGGADAEVSGETANVLLESAYFTRTGVLRTARRLELHSEASHRFERGTDPEGTGRAAARCAALIAAWSGGRVLPGTAEAGGPPERRWVSMRPTRASALLGYEVSPADAAGAFEVLRMQIRAGEERLEVEVPGYRVDIEREVDLIEEVARIQGYDRIASTLPTVRQAGGMPPSYAFRRRLRDVLLRAGLHEACLLSFASERDLAIAAGTSTADAPFPIRLANPLLADEAALRTGLLPGLLHVAARNRARDVRSVALFELGTVFRAGDPVDERSRVAAVLHGAAGEGWDAAARSFDALDARGVVEALMDDLGIASWSLDASAAGASMHPGRSATILVGDEAAGVVGELHPRLAEELELQGRVALVELEVAALASAAGATRFALREVPRFPPIRRDLAFVVPEDVPAGAVQDALDAAAGELLGSSLLFDVHRGDPLPAGMKSLAFEVEFRAAGRTLTGEEADRAVAAIVDRLEAGFGATIRSG